MLHLLGLFVGLLLSSYSLLLISLALLGRCWKTPRFYARWLFVYTTLTICAAYGIFVCGVFWFMGRYSSVQWAVSRTFHYLTAPVVGLKYDIEGEEILGSLRPAIYVCNHQS
jgi:lysophosphatidate acyltransferase